MGGATKTIVRAAEAGATGGLSEFTHGTDAFGLKTGLQAVGLMGKGYTPQTLAASDPAMQLAQSGGAPLLTNIALGANVDDALASYFGRQSGQDFKAWLATQSPDQQAAINGVKDQLTSIQGNTELRNKAVQQVVKDYPNLVQQLAPKIAEAKKAAGEEFDSASKAYLDYAMNQTAAKYAAGGSISSGAHIQAQADNAAKMGMDRLQYTKNAGDTEFDRGANDLLGEWNSKYTEANALRSFQQKMLGQGAAQGFSAAKAGLDRNADVARFNADAANQKSQSDQASDNALLGAVGSLGGTALSYGMSRAATPAATAAISAKRASLPNNASAGYGA